jgi:hypothetical protein
MNTYESIIANIFELHRNGNADFEFDRAELIAAAHRLEIPVPKNIGDAIYTFRYRKDLPEVVRNTQPEGLNWLILGAGDARYRCHLGPLLFFKPTPGLMVRKIPDATPEIISQYALTDEQALLAKIRYNRLLDAFLGIVAYSLQSHLRTKIENYGQIEIDELYVGVDSNGEQYIVPVQAKGGTDRLGVIQTIQDTIYCRKQNRYKHATPRPVSAQFMPNNTIALFELHFDEEEEIVTIIRERHYRLTEAKDITPTDLQNYRMGVD